ncbi:MAG TPA: TetR/AcrR family transcriptional regulator [Kofleriaceae bacterium]|nr:TetR/AcrR family transcriptional regulator [Kofleriaceae bacterium]
MTTTQERKAQDRQARRRKIQDAARTVFADRGYAGSSIEQIARASQLSVGAIYLYFRSKEDLYVSLIEDALTVFDVEFSQLRTTADAAMRLPKAWAALLAWAARDAEGPRVLRLLAQPGVRAQLSDEVAATAAAQLDKLQQHFAAMIADGNAAGIYRDAAPAPFATLVWSLFLGVLDAVQIDQNLANVAVDGEALADRGNRALQALEGALGLPRAAVRIVA